MPRSERKGALFACLAVAAIFSGESKNTSHNRSIVDELN